MGCGWRFITTLRGAAHWKQLKRRGRCRFGKMTRKEKKKKKRRNLISILSLLREQGQADTAPNQYSSCDLRNQAEKCPRQSRCGSLLNGLAPRGSWRTGRYCSLVASAGTRDKKAAALVWRRGCACIIHVDKVIITAKYSEKEADIPSFPPPLCRSSAGLT